MKKGYLTIFDGDTRAIDTPSKYENDPTLLQIYNTIFGEGE